MKNILSENAPKPIGPYAQAIEVGGFLFISGQLPVDPATDLVVDGGVEAQARQSMENISAILAQAGYQMKHVAKTTCFLKDMKDFPAFNSVYAQYFAHCPARSCVAVRELPKDVLCEIEVIACKN